MLSLVDLYNSWQAFFYNPEPAVVMGLYRMCIGLLCCYKAMSLWRNRYAFFGENGWYPYASWINGHSGRNFFSIFKYIQCSNNNINCILGLYFIFSLMLTVGLFTEVSAVCVYLLFISINHRNIYIFNAGDSLLKIILFFLMFSSCGYGLSVDNYINNRDQMEYMINPWVHRILQILLTTVYLQSVYHKINLGGSDWRDGYALHYALNNKMLNRYHICLNMPMICIMIGTYMVILLELICPVGLWFKETVLVCSLLLLILNICFETILRIGNFGVLMMMNLVLFINASWLIKTITA
jgi:hypothetical protein